MGSTRLAYWKEWVRRNEAACAGELAKMDRREDLYRGELRELEVLIDGAGRDGDGTLTARTKNGRLVHLQGDGARIGEYVNVRITGSSTWALAGEIV